MFDHGCSTELHAMSANTIDAQMMLRTCHPSHNNPIHCSAAAAPLALRRLKNDAPSYTASFDMMHSIHFGFSQSDADCADHNCLWPLPELQKKYFKFERKKLNFETNQ